MRAPFNTTCTLLDGLTTATPLFPRVVDAACRVVSDLFFVDVLPPLSPSIAYFTIASDQPTAPPTANLGMGVWSFDFGKADVVQFALFPGVLWQVVRVETCTWPVAGAPYWRASVIQIDPPPAACSDSYLECYQWKGIDDPGIGEVLRVGTTAWVDDLLTLDAEAEGPPGDECMSVWIFKRNDVTYAGTWNGSGTGILTATDGSGWTVEIFPCL